MTYIAQKQKNIDENSRQNRRSRRVCRLGAWIFLFGTSCVLFSGCASGVFHEGAYVGNDAQYDSQARPAQRPLSSVPVFASRDVKEDAKNRVAMERATGRPVMARCVTVNDVIGWHQAGVRDENIIIHIRTHGLCQPLQSQDELTLQNHGVSVPVIRAMREHPYPKVDAPVPPEMSQGGFFSRPNTSPNTNPGSGYETASTAYETTAPSSTRAPIPTAAPPVTTKRMTAGTSSGTSSGVPSGVSYGVPVGGMQTVPAEGFIVDEGCCYFIQD